MKEVKLKDIKDNAILEFKEKFALVCARSKNSFNMCTVSWGSFGELWSKDVATVYIKPIRFTDKFMQEDDYFTITFFDDSKEELILCGTKSGREIDKTKIPSLKPIQIENGITFEGYRRVYVLKKIYMGQFKKEEFIASNEIIDRYYKDEPMHHFYVGEITKIYEK